MLYQREAKVIAEAWAKENLDDYLRGKELLIPDFPDERTARFFNPERGLDDHQLVIASLAEIGRKRGAYIVYITLTRDDYEAFIATGAEDSPEARFAYLQQSCRVENA